MLPRATLYSCSFAEMSSTIALSVGLQQSPVLPAGAMGPPSVETIHTSAPQQQQLFCIETSTDPSCAYGRARTSLFFSPQQPSLM